MKVTTPEISWHERDPIYSVDIQPGKRKIKRLVTGGVDKFVRIWQIKEDIDNKASVEFLASLKRHTKAVNVCRFSPDGDILATAGDDSVIIFWKQGDASQANNIFQDEGDEENKENWCMLKVLRGHLEDIYDLCWSADGKYMISGSVDNSAIMWDLTKDQKIALLNDHQSFVQGVAWDPKNEFAATLSTDRSCRVFSINKQTCLHTIRKMTLPSTNANNENGGENKDSKPKSFRMFHDDTMRSFFRRLTFTPDGELLIVPSGCVEAEPVCNATFVFSRNCFSKPALYLPSPEKFTIAVRCCPTKFELRKVLREVVGDSQDSESGDLKEWEKYSTLFCLPYRIVFAVATEDSIQLYDTQQQQPFGFITNVHYHQLSDVAWSTDGRNLVVSSTDGYCTLVTFDDGELGIPYVDKEAVEEKSNENQDDVVMETDPCSEDLHLILDTSNDEARTSDVETCAAVSPVPPKPMAMKVKSADGKLKNIQITTLTSNNSIKNNTGPAKVPEIKVRSTDGKPRNVQITTLASYTSPKSKGSQSSNVKTEELPSKSDNEKTKDILKEKTNTNTDIDCIVMDEDNDKSACISTPKRATNAPSADGKPGDGKPTPKRVQLTTIQLFSSNNQSPKQNKSEENSS